MKTETIEEFKLRGGRIQKVDFSKAHDKYYGYGHANKENKNYKLRKEEIKNGKENKKSCKEKISN